MNLSQVKEKRLDKLRKMTHKGWILKGIPLMDKIPETKSPRQEGKSQPQILVEKPKNNRVWLGFTLIAIGLTWGHLWYPEGILACGIGLAVALGNLHACRWATLYLIFSIVLYTGQLLEMLLLFPLGHTLSGLAHSEQYRTTVAWLAGGIVVRVMVLIGFDNPTIKKAYAYAKLPPPHTGWAVFLAIALSLGIYMQALQVRTGTNARIAEELAKTRHGERLEYEAQGYKIVDLGLYKETEWTVDGYNDEEFRRFKIPIKQKTVAEINHEPKILKERFETYKKRQMDRKNKAMGE